MVIWIIGLSGAGKTTLASAVVERVRSAGRKVVMLDGDAVRGMFGNDLGHTLEDRKKNADRICQLGKFLEMQGIDVVCAILSLFQESRNWNRTHLQDYFEVFIDTPMEQMAARDVKGLYARYEAGQIKGVAGLDLPFIPPEKPDLVIHNAGNREDLLAYAGPLAAKILEKA
jgi:adenylyl-sulfate kinase